MERGEVAGAWAREIRGVLADVEGASAVNASSLRVGRGETHFRTGSFRVVRGLSKVETGSADAWAETSIAGTGSFRVAPLRDRSFSVRRMGNEMADSLRVGRGEDTGRSRTTMFWVALGFDLT